MNSFVKHFSIVLGLVVLLTAGCDTLRPVKQTTWVTYDDEQSSWPTSPTGLLHLVDGFPIYGPNQLPSTPYKVVGIIHALAPIQTGNRAVVNEAEVVALARTHGGQAALITKESDPARPSSARATDYLVVEFNKDYLRQSLEHINFYLMWAAANTNGYTGPDGHGGTVHYSAEEIATNRIELEALKRALLAAPEFQPSTGKLKGDTNVIAIP